MTSSLSDFGIVGCKSPPPVQFSLSTPKVRRAAGHAASRRTRLRWFVLGLGLALFASSGALYAATALVAAASDLKFAFDTLKPMFERSHAPHRVTLVMGSSGKFAQQIENGAPFDLFFSADVAFPRRLVERGDALAPVRSYAFGRIVLWSAKTDASRLSVAELADERWRRIAIAAPDHAPYGARAKEALIHAGVWDSVEPRLVYGENIAQTAQLVQTQAADIGIVALSLAMSPQLADQGGHALIPQALHAPLEQAYVITRAGRNNPAAQAFAEFMASPAARQVMRRYGFLLPGESGEPKE